MSSGPPGDGQEGYYSSSTRRSAAVYPSLSSPDDHAIFTPYTPQVPETPFAPVGQRPVAPAPVYASYEAVHPQAQVPLEMLPEPADMQGSPSIRESPAEVATPGMTSGEPAWRPTLSRSAPPRWGGVDSHTHSHKITLINHTSVVHTHMRFAFH